MNGALKFDTFINILNSELNTDQAFSRAYESIKDYISVGRIISKLTQPVSDFSVLEENLEKIIYDSGKEMKEDPAVEKLIVNNEGGLVTLLVYQEKDKDAYTEEEKEYLGIILDVLNLHLARYWLSSKVYESSLINSVSGLLNSIGFVRELGKRRVHNKLKDYDILYFNLRNFGLINQYFGGLEGDECIRRYSKLLMDKFVKGEVLSHFGGDNYAAIVYKYRRDTLLSALNNIVIYAMNDGNKVPIKINARVGIYPILEEDTPEKVMTAASEALSIARAEKREVFVITPKVQEKIVVQKLLLHEFDRALSKKIIEVYYQPKINVETGKIIGAEALARWNRKGEILMPKQFIPLLEKNRKSFDLDIYVLKKVCKDLKKWKEMGLDIVPVSVNISRQDICDDDRGPKDTANIILRIIEEAGIDPSLIMLEVTETTDANEQKQLFEFMTELCLEGIATSIDDFGTGYSSLSILRDFPITEIKIDKSFISYERLGKNDEIIVRSIISMAKKLGIDVITEGVETEEQIRFLKEQGCVKVQGFFYDAPLEEGIWEDRLRIGTY